MQVHPQSWLEAAARGAYLAVGEGGGSKPDRPSRFSGTYSCTSITLLMLPMSSYMHGRLGS
jgi:hypothetical protein